MREALQTVRFHIKSLSASDWVHYCEDLPAIGQLLFFFFSRLQKTAREWHWNSTEPLISVMESRNWHTPSKRIPKYYVKNEVLNIEEDQTHEFKGHRNISVYDIPPWCINADENIRTRNAISRYWYEEITLFAS